MSDSPEQTVDLKFRAVVVKAERAGQVGLFRAVVPNAENQLMLDLTSIMPADQVRKVQIDDYAEITIRIRKKEAVEAELDPALRADEAFVSEVDEVDKPERHRHLRVA